MCKSYYVRVVFDPASEFSFALVIRKVAVNINPPPILTVEASAAKADGTTIDSTRQNVTKSVSMRFFMFFPPLKLVQYSCKESQIPKEIYRLKIPGSRILNTINRRYHV